MPGVCLKLHDREGKLPGVAQVLKNEGHVLIYNPHPMAWDGLQWKVSLLRSPMLKVRSAGYLGSFYPVLCAEREDQQTTWSPPEEITVDYGPPKTEMPRLTVGDVDANIDWDTDDVQDRSCTPSPSAGIGKIMLGESAEDTPPVRQNICLVSECVIEPGAVPPQENIPEVGENESKDDDAPLNEEQPKLVSESDVVGLVCEHRGAVVPLQNDIVDMTTELFSIKSGCKQIMLVL